MLPAADVFLVHHPRGFEITESQRFELYGFRAALPLALMDAGVPMKALVAGIAMGLVEEGEKSPFYRHPR